MSQSPLSFVVQLVERAFFRDEKAASFGAAQESLPSVGCPPWVLVDQE